MAPMSTQELDPTNVADDRGRRLDAATGVIAAILFLVGFSIPGMPPGPDDALQKIVGYLTDKRSAILTADVVIAVATGLYIWFLGALRSYLRAGEGGEGRLSAASFLGGGVGAAMILAGTAIQSALVLHTATLSSEAVVRVGFDGYNALFTIGGIGFAIAVAAASCSAARSGALPASIYWTGSVIAVLQLATLAALFEKSGFFAAGEGLTLIAFVTLSAWYIAVALMIIRRRGIPPVMRTEP
jgi:hypothetical protein